VQIQTTGHPYLPVKEAHRQRPWKALWELIAPVEVVTALLKQQKDKLMRTEQQEDDAWLDENLEQQKETLTRTETTEGRMLRMKQMKDVC
ncbi:hypothetical protein AVEN_125509-2-1, partial [Araneus ventricosus]